MIKLLDIITRLEGRIEGGSEYQWHSFGPNARILDFPNVGVVFDSVTQEVYAIDVWPNNYDDDAKTVLWVAPGHEVAYRKESKARGFYNPDSVDQCYSFMSIMTIAVAVMDELPFDPSLVNDVELFFDEGELEMVMKAAELEGMTLDEFVNAALKEKLDSVKSTKKKQKRAR
jgi:hypothetical protein